MVIFILIVTSCDSHASEFPRAFMIARFNRIIVKVFENIQVKAIPRTISGKIVELAVRKVIHGEVVKNKDALANPEALAFFINLPELLS